MFSKYYNQFDNPNELLLQCGEMYVGLLNGYKNKKYLHIIDKKRRNKYDDTLYYFR